MESLEPLQKLFVDFIPLLITLAISALIIWAINWALSKRQLTVGSDQQFSKQIIILCCVAIAIIAAVLALPIGDVMRNQVLTLLGIVLTAIITLSSTTFVANMMASFMLRAVNGFKLGNFIKVNDQFGRVTERGLFHTEIQTEDGDLTTLPNLYLVTHPVSVIRSSGTVVSAEVSLGYDLPIGKIEKSLIAAAEATGLREPFVHVKELGDFSILYRVAGILEDGKQVLSTRSKLRRNMVEALHKDKVEIVSPNFMNQRVLGENEIFIPDWKEHRKHRSSDEAHDMPEDKVFDKAEEAEKAENIKEEIQTLSAEINALKESVAGKEGPEKDGLDLQIQLKQKRIERLKEAVSKPAE